MQKICCLVNKWLQMSASVSLWYPPEVIIYYLNTTWCARPIFSNICLIVTLLLRSTRSWTLLTFSRAVTMLFRYVKDDVVSWLALSDWPFLQQGMKYHIPGNFFPPLCLNDLCFRPFSMYTFIAIFKFWTPPFNYLV